jgi:tRNA uridine 5-carbamoylmethylation protein Kti12
MAKLIVIAGLPGSGKSHRIRAVKDKFAGICVEDFHANAINHSPKFEHSRHYTDLISSLSNSKDCLIADIAYCESDRRLEVERTVRREIPNVVIEWEFFENAPVKCEDNCRRRNRSSLPREIELIRDLSQKYLIPEGALVLSVFQNAKE